jgi:Skp family chaperone for outer membrane proteins
MKKLAEELAAKQRELDQMRREAEDKEDALKSQVSELRYEAQKAALDVRAVPCPCVVSCVVCRVCRVLSGHRTRSHYFLQAEAEAAKATMLALTNSDLLKVRSSTRAHGLAVNARLTPHTRQPHTTI